MNPFRVIAVKILLALGDELLSKMHVGTLKDKT